MQGFRTNGLGYLKHFMGPVWWLAPLMFVIEVCSHLARMLSLTVRLFANMFAGDMVTLVFFSLVPIGVPVIFLILHFGVSLIQTMIFVLLPMVYIGEAVAHEH
jgi:F-type H+-transporting ATPase subunit a